MGGKILIVDDQPIMLRLVGHPLERSGYTTVTATTGAEALNKLQSEQPDLVILDVMLPDFSGLEICQRIREAAQFHELPIIMLSGQSEVDDKIMGFEAGADEYITKPVDPKEMVVRVKALLARTERLRNAASPSAGRQGRTVCCIGAKGGVGVSSLVLNLSYALTRLQQLVVAAELRPYFGSFARQLGLHPRENLGQLLENAAGSITPQVTGKYLQVAFGDVRVLCGPQGLKEYRELESEQIEAVTRSLTQMADYLLIDLPNWPSVANRAALRLSDLILLATEPEPTSVDAAAALLDLLGAWNIPRSAVKTVIVNRMQSVQALSVGAITRQLNCETIGVVPAAPDLYVRASELGRPVTISAPDSLATRSIIEIAGQLHGQFGDLYMPKPSAPVKNSFSLRAK